MDFNHTQDRRMLVDTFGRYLSDRYAFKARDKIANSDDGWSRDQWNTFAELGIIGALFDEQSGGFGGTGFDIAAIFEQLGRALVVEPFLSTLLAGRILSHTDSNTELLAAMIAGSKLVVFAHEEPQSRYELSDIASQAMKVGAQWSITGAKSVVPQLEAADHIVISARTHGEPSDAAGIALFLVDRRATGLTIRGYPLIDGGRGGELTLHATPATLIAKDAFATIEESIAIGIVALTWEAIGIMDTLLFATLEYLRTRQQFGVPIGKFQALQHRVATVALEIEQARSAAINAAAALEVGRDQRERSVSAAKYTIGRIGTLVAEEAIQMHGGIGMTWELPLSHYAKRLNMIGHQLGDEDHHLERFIALSSEATADAN